MKYLAALIIAALVCSKQLNTNHSSEFCTPVSCVSMSSMSLCDITKGEEVLANIEAVRQRSEALRHVFPELAELYDKFIEPKFQAAAGHRNGFIVEAAPVMYRVVCVSLALQLLDFFYQMHRPLFKDTLKNHHYEAQKMLESVAASYRGSLNAIERKIYDALPSIERDAFRILRDLAFWPHPKLGRYEFFMSCKQLGDRLQMDRQIAYRILRDSRKITDSSNAWLKASSGFLVKSRKQVCFAGSLHSRKAFMRTVSSCTLASLTISGSSCGLTTPEQEVERLILKLRKNVRLNDCV